MNENMAAEKESTSFSAGSEEVFDIVCFPCNSGGKHIEAEGYCMDCGEHLCVQCLKYHRTLSVTKPHTLVDKENMPTDTTGSVIKDRCTQKCTIHEGKVIEYFCLIHKILGCNACIALKHKLCESVCYIPDITADLVQSQEYMDFKQHLDQLIRRSEGISTSAEQKMKTSADFYFRVQQDICTFRNEINTALDKLEMEIKEKLEQINTDNNDGLNALSREATKAYNELKALVANFQKLISDKQKCTAYTQMKTKMNDLAKLQDSLEKMENTQLQVGKFVPNKELLQMLKGADVLGKLCVRNASKLEVALVADIDATSESSNEMCDISGVVVLPSGKLVFTDLQNDAVKLIDLANNKITSELKLKRFPWAVTSLTEAKVAVTLPTAQKIVVLTCGVKLKIEKVVSVKGECYGIAYFKGKLIVTFDNPSKLEILGMAGDVLQRFEKDEQGHQLITNCRYVSVHMEDPAIFVSDWDNDSLTKMSMDGKVLAVYKDPELSMPGQCVIDQAGLVYLCGTYSDNIHILTADCTRLKTVLRRTDGLRRPSSISYCETTGRLYLGMRRNDLIKVYQLQD